MMNINMNFISSEGCHFHARAIAKRRKAWFHLRMSRILFAVKHSQTTLRMSRPLLLAVICRSRGGLSANVKEENFASNDDNPSFCIYFQSTTLPMLPT